MLRAEIRADGVRVEPTLASPSAPKHKINNVDGNGYTKQKTKCILCIGSIIDRGYSTQSVLF